jgi:hypothetical protein
MEPGGFEVLVVVLYLLKMFPHLSAATLQWMPTFLRLLAVSYIQKQSPLLRCWVVLGTRWIEHLLWLLRRPLELEAGEYKADRLRTRSRPEQTSC